MGDRITVSAGETIDSIEAVHRGANSSGSVPPNPMSAPREHYVRDLSIACLFSNCCWDLLSMQIGRSSHNYRMLTYRVCSPFQIVTAITFLENQNVKRNPLNQKQQFLRSKGLTEDEIQIACERAGIFTGEPSTSTTLSTVIDMDTTTTATSANGYVQRHIMRNGAAHQTLTTSHNRSLLQFVREIVSASVLLAGVPYVIYLFYKVRESNVHELRQMHGS